MKAELPPDTLVNNRYLIRKTLGQGGFGRTYLAFDQQSFDDKCVLKEFIAQGTGDEQKALELFEREAKTLHQLNHPQIPKFLAWFEEDGRLFLVQDYVNGQTYWSILQNYLKQGRAFSPAEIRQFLQSLLEVLEYIHQKGIIHRDISPDNIMLSQESSLPMLIDFGVVRRKITQMASSGRQTYVGKQGYSAPEQLRTGDCFPSSDLYALGVTVIVLLTGKGPSDLYDRHNLQWQWSSLVQIEPDFQMIIDKMLQEKPPQRYQSAHEVLCALNALSPNSPQQSSSTEDSSNSGSQNSPETKFITPPSSPLPIPPRPRLPRWFAVGVLSGILVVGAGVVWLSPYIEPLCQIMGNCDLNYQIYQQAYTTAQQAISLSKKAQNIDDLQNASNNLNQAISQLNTIPFSARSYRQVTKVLPDYQTQAEAIKTRITQEQEYQLIVKDAQAIAKETAKKIEEARSITALEQEIKSIQDTIAELESVTAESFVYSQLQAILSQLIEQKEQINTRIQEEKRYEEKWQQAEAIAVEAYQLTGEVVNQSQLPEVKLEKLKTVKAKWQQALEQLNSIPSDSLMTPQVVKNRQEYEQELTKVNKKIEACENVIFGEC